MPAVGGKSFCAPKVERPMSQLPVQSMRRRLPAQSKASLAAGGSAGSVYASRVRPISPKGRLIQNVQRQPRVWVRRPPSGGPKAAASPKTAPTSPAQRLLSLGGKSQASVANAAANSPPPPMPCTARPAISHQKAPDKPCASPPPPGVSPHQTEPITYSPNAPTTTGLRGSISTNRPTTTVAIVLKKR